MVSSDLAVDAATFSEKMQLLAGEKWMEGIRSVFFL